MRRASFAASPGDPPDDEPPMHPLSEEVCVLLEDAGVAQEIIDRICIGIDELAGRADQACPACLARLHAESERDGEDGHE